MLTCPVPLPQTEIYTSAWTVTHDERNFHEPMTFKPERWLDPDCTDIKEASQPFSLGTRMCLGQKLVSPPLSPPPSFLGPAFRIFASCRVAVFRLRGWIVTNSNHPKKLLVSQTWKCPSF